MTCFVIIPAYKPDEGLIGLCSEVCGLGYKVITVDDGGGEEYKRIFEALDSRVTVLRHETNRGKGAGIKTALEYIKTVCSEGDFVGTMDADGQHLPGDMKKVMELAEKNPGRLALGVRVIDKQMPWKSRAGNSITKATFALLTGTKVSDTQTGLRAFSVGMIDDMLKVKGERYEYEMNVLSFYGNRKKSICETPIEVIYRDRKNSTSHFRPFRDGLKVYFQLFGSAIIYSLSAIISFLVDYGMLCLLLWLLNGSLGDFTDVAANVGARMVSAPLNYFLNCRLAFGRKSTLKNALGYVLLCLFTIAVDTGVLYLWKFTGLPTQIAKIPTEICMFIFNYFVQKRIVFKK